MSETKKWWVAVSVPSGIAIITGFKAEIGSQFAGWWTALTPWRFLFWGSILWIAATLIVGYLNRRFSSIEVRLTELGTKLDTEILDRHNGETKEAKTRRDLYVTLLGRIATLEKGK